MRAAGACPARHRLVLCCHARCDAAAASWAPVRCSGVLPVRAAVLVHSNIAQGGCSRRWRAGWLTVRASHAGWSARWRHSQRGCRWRAWPRGGTPRWAPWGGCAGSSRAQPSKRTPRACLRHSVWTRHPCRGAGTPAEGQAPLQRGSAASGQTALCACQWRAGVPSGRRSQHCMAEVCIHRCFCRLCGPGRNACGAAGQQLCWRCCKGLCQGRKPCTVSLNSVLYCARRANAGRGQGAAALSAHMREANQFLNAALVLCNALNQVRPGMTAGVVGSILDQLCSALPVLLVRC